MKKHKSGFTLAEVLITLVIIGIIAAMTIPTLINKTNEQETVVAVKKAFSTLSQAHQRMVAENGEINPQTFGNNINSATKNFGDAYSKYFNVTKNCGINTVSDCFSSKNGGMYKYFDGRDWYIWNSSYSAATSSSHQHYKMILNDGTSLALFIYNDFIYDDAEDSMKYVFGSIFVDVNGYKQPNTLGKDVFCFWITKNGIIPYGRVNETKYPFSTCRTTGSGCAAWVVTKGNMDYLRKEVSW